LIFHINVITFGSAATDAVSDAEIDCRQHITLAGALANRWDRSEYQAST